MRDGGLAFPRFEVLVTATMLSAGEKWRSHEGDPIMTALTLTMSRESSQGHDGQLACRCRDNQGVQTTGEEGEAAGVAAFRVAGEVRGF